ncbi:cobalamin biosynthesis protein CobG [Streptomyces sp. NPDC052225]|uniref:cobalamin biosynthesis protein CobG n=1 Tax=Streptomyces sp. NPDC052225 TaxID=3154949 RepID=UPI00343274E2
MSPAPISTQSPGPAASGDACPGALRLHAADDGGLARIRVPGGVLPVGRARALGDAARRFGDGVVRITSRGNVEVRGLDPACGGEFATALQEAGLLPSAAHERVRNILASPLSGLDDQGFVDVRDWLLGLDDLLCASTRTPALSGKFLFALDDGRGDVAPLGADVLLRGEPDGSAVLRLGAEPYELRIAYEEAARAAVCAAEEFVAAAKDDTGRGWRVAELALRAGELTRRVGERLGTAPEPVRERTTAGPTPLGTVTDARGTVRARSVLVPFGAVTADAWTALLDAAGPEIRLTPWRGVVLPGAHRPENADLVTEPGSPWTRVSACVGSPGCAKSRTDVRADAAETVRSGDLAAAGHPWHWSGCERRCGRPKGPHTDVVAREDGTYDVTPPGTTD